MTTLAKYADEVKAIADQLSGPVDIRRKLYDMAERMRRDASVTPNAKPMLTFGRPISGGREVHVVRERRRG